jgi:hypothetical protein
MKKLHICGTDYFEDFVNVAVALDVGAEVFLSRDSELAEAAKTLIKILPPKQFILDYFHP